MNLADLVRGKVEPTIGVLYLQEVAKYPLNGEMF